MSDRFILRELQGWTITPRAGRGESGGATRGPAPIHLTVLDSAYCYRVVWHSMPRQGPIARRRAKTHKLLDELNQKHQ